MPLSLTFKNCTFFPQCFFFVLYWSLKKTAIISLYSINWLFFFYGRDGVCLLRGTYWIYVKFMPVLVFNRLSNKRYMLPLKCNYWSKGAGTAGTTHRTEHGLTDMRTRARFPEEARGSTLLCAFRKMLHYIPDCLLAPYTGWFRMKGRYFWRW